MKTTPLRLAGLFAVCLSFYLSSCTKEKEPPIDTTKALLHRGYGFNNGLLTLQDLDSASTYYSKVLGFSVRNAGSPVAGRFEGTLQTSISLADMSTFNLVHDSLAGDNSPDGMRRYSLSTSSADSTFAWLTQRGFIADSVQQYWVPSPPMPQSKWTDSVNGVLRTAVLEENSNYLPEFEEQANFPYNRMHEFESFYIFQREFMRHANGVVGVSGVEVGVQDLEKARAEMEQLGLVEVPDSTLQDGFHFRLKENQLLTLVKADKSGVQSLLFDVIQLDSTRQFLKKNLPEGSLVELEESQQILVPAEHAFGLTLKFVQEPEEQANRVASLSLNFGGKLDSVASANAARMYSQYCALCHGEDREGYAADHSPSLKSNSLLASAKGTNFMRYTIQYGRANTAMGGYYEDQGGPMSYIEIELLLKWLYEQAEVEDALNLSREPVEGSVALGEEIYSAKCAVCHGVEGEGVTAPALGNSMLLATATDEFLRYAIQEGRDGTPMIGYKDSLSEAEINGVTAYLRSRAAGWNVPQGDTIRIPSREEYVLNPQAKSPEFTLKEDLYLSAAQLDQAMKDSLQLVILDARSEVAWRQMHIPGSFPVPYYDDPTEAMEGIDKENTWVVAYCACPHAASGQVVTKLRKMGFKKTAIMDEGILVWAQEGYPVRNGQ